MRGCWRPAPPQVSYRGGPLRRQPNPANSGEAATTESTRVWTRVPTNARFSQGSTWGPGWPLSLTLIFPTLTLLRLAGPFCGGMSLPVGSATSSLCGIQALPLERVERPHGASPGPWLEGGERFPSVLPLGVLASSPLMPAAASLWRPSVPPPPPRRVNRECSPGGALRRCSLPPRRCPPRSLSFLSFYRSGLWFPLLSRGFLSVTITLRFDAQMVSGWTRGRCFKLLLCLFGTFPPFLFSELCRLPSTRYLRSSCMLCCPSSGTSPWRMGPRVRSAAAGVKLGSGCRHTCPDTRRHLRFTLRPGQCVHVCSEGTQTCVHTRVLRTHRAARVHISICLLSVAVPPSRNM